MFPIFQDMYCTKFLSLNVKFIHSVYHKALRISKTSKGSSY